MSDKTKVWLRAAGIRAGKTFAQTALSMIMEYITENSDSVKNDHKNYII